MQNAESNPGQAQQNEIAARSPAHTPAAGTASPDARTQAREFGSRSAAGSAEPTHSQQDKRPSVLPDIDLDAYTSSSPDPVQKANSRNVSVDVANTAASDSTVDTDGKSLEARRHQSVWHDNVISSNDTLENCVAAPARALAVDSRESGNLPMIACRPGWRMVYCETAYDAQMSGSRAEHVIRLERIAEE
jgi:hypothetical protein